MCDFSLFEREFGESLRKAINLIDSLPSCQDSKSKSASVDSINALLGDCGELIKGIELDITSLDVSTKKKYRDILLQRKSELRGAKNRLDNNQLNNASSNRHELIGERSQASREKFLSLQDKFGLMQSKIHVILNQSFAMQNRKPK